MRTPESGKRTCIVVAAATIGALSPLGQANAFPTQNGGSGLFFTRTAETTQNGSVDFFGLGRLDSYEMPAPSESDLDIIIAPGINYGLGDRTEIGLLVSAVDNDATSESGVRYLQSHLKHRFFGGSQHEWGGAFTLFAGKGGAKEALSSGEAVYGAELNFSYLSGAGGTHLLVGYEQSDTKQLLPALDFVNEPKIKAAAGFDFSTSADSRLSLEFIATKGLDTDDENIFFVPALRYQIGSFQYGVGISIGVPEDRSEPHRSYFAQISYTTGEPMRKNPDPIESTLDAIKVETEQVALSLEQQSQRLADLEGKLLNMGPVAAATSEALVEVVCGSALDELGKQLGKRLRGKGYRVSAVRTSGDDPTPETWIYYRPGFAPDAVKLGNSIPRTQNVVKDSSLPIDIDIRIVVGEDLSTTPASAVVEVLANGDVASAAARIANSLNRAGYRVVNTSGVDAASIGETWIRYRAGRASSAVSLGKLLPGDQTVVKDNTLPEGIDMRIVVGRDQVQSADN